MALALNRRWLLPTFARGKMNSHHSDILIHWTSKELSGKCPSEPHVQDEYLALLRSIYSKGLRFSHPKTPDVVAGVDCHSIIKTKPIICFTELQLSRAQAHAHRYGGLGIGFNREFLMKWGANPVFYMQSKNQGIVNTNLSGLVMKDKPDWLDVFLSYVKPMGERCSDNYLFYDEFEWRIVGCKLGKQLPGLFVEDEGDLWFRFKPKDIMLLAFPNEDTRRKALADPELMRKFNDHMPMLVDTSNCYAF